RKQNRKDEESQGVGALVRSRHLDSPLVHWKKVACGAFFETPHGCRRQKARFLPAALARSYAQSRPAEDTSRVSSFHQAGSKRRPRAPTKRSSMRYSTPRSEVVRITRPAACTTFCRPGYRYVYAYPAPKRASIRSCISSLTRLTCGSPRVATNAPISR